MQAMKKAKAEAEAKAASMAAEAKAKAQGAVAGALPPALAQQVVPASAPVAVAQPVVAQQPAVAAPAALAPVPVAAEPPKSAFASLKDKKDAAVGAVQDKKDAASAKVQGVKDTGKNAVAARTESLQEGKWATLIASGLALFDQLADILVMASFLDAGDTNWFLASLSIMVVSGIVTGCVQMAAAGPAGFLLGLFGLHPIRDAVRKFNGKTDESPNTGANFSKRVTLSRHF